MYANIDGQAMPESGVVQNWTIAGVEGGIRTGTSQNDIFHSRRGDTLVGGQGDDRYYLWDPSWRITENAGQGIDTIYVGYWGGITMPDNVENLVLDSAGATFANGNALGNVMIAGPGGTMLDGGKGNDILVGGTGADVFKITAGNGSDAIVNFRSGWDAIKLSGYGITSFGQVLANAEQVGADVKIRLSSSESLLLRGTQLSSLGAYDFNLSGTASATPVGSKTMSGLFDSANAHGWYVNNNAWGSTGLTIGQDYKLTSTYNSADMTKGTTFNWSYDVITADKKVLAYPEVIFGYGLWNYTGSNPTDTAHVLPVQVSKLTGLTADYDVSYKGNASGFNIAFDIWFSKSATALGTENVSNEVMIWLHKGAFEPFGTVVGTYTQGDFSAKIYHEGTYTAFVPDEGKDLLASKIDIGEMFDKLIAMGILSPTEYLRTVDLGAEVVSGTGSMTINNLDLAVETRTDSGGTVTKLVTGAGTQVIDGSTTAAAAENTAAALPAVDLRADFKAGTVSFNDDYGNALVKTTVVKADGSAVATTATVGGSVVAIDEIGAGTQNVTVTHLTGDRKLLGTTQLRAADDRSIWTTEVDVDGAKTGAVRSFTAADGAKVTESYDGAGKLMGSQGVATLADGVLTKHFDASGKLTGAEKALAGSTVVQHLDASLAVVSIDKTIVNSNGTTTIQHLDAKSVLQSWDVVKVANSSITTYHYDAKGVLQDIAVDRLDAGNVVKSIDYDGKWNVEGATFAGTALNDTMAGAPYNTEYHGGLGSDRINGGSGVDKIHFDTVIGKGDVDQIISFKSGVDKLVLDKDVFAGLVSNGVLASSEFVIGPKALTTSQHIVYDRANGDLYYDADGSGAQAAVLFADLGNGALLSSNDFVIA